MVIHLGIQDALGERLLQAVEKAVRIKGRLWIGPSQQLVQDGIRNMRRFASRHGWAPFHPSCPPTHEIPDSLRARVAGRQDRCPGGPPPFGPPEVAAMSRTVSPSRGRPYGLARVCRVWRASRATTYRHLAPSRPEPPRRPGPVGPMPDAALVEAIRAVLTASPFHGEGHRKVWARLRVAGLRTSKRRVLRLIPSLVDENLS